MNYFSTNLLHGTVHVLEVICKQYVAELLMTHEQYIWCKVLNKNHSLSLNDSYLLAGSRVIQLPEGQNSVELLFSKQMQ